MFHRREIIAGMASVAFLPVEAKASSSLTATKLINAARAQTQNWVWYDSQYTPIAYPDGDVAPDHGVCADVIIRAYRSLGIDLQKLVHQDMTAHFALYPNAWHLRYSDSNIDHRRVPNLRVFFSRFGTSLPISSNPKDYKPGDILTTRPWGRPHISIVSERHALWGMGNLMVIQNAGFGVQENDDLMRFPITGRYRYLV